jgi:hypothetical protein
MGDAGYLTVRFDAGRRAQSNTAAAPAQRPGRRPTCSSKSSRRGHAASSERTAAARRGSAPSDGATAIVSRTSQPARRQRSWSSRAGKRRNGPSVAFRAGSARKPSRSSRPNTARAGARRRRPRLDGGRRARYLDRSPDDGAISSNKLPSGRTKASIVWSNRSAWGPANPSGLPSATTSFHRPRSSGGRRASARMREGTGPGCPASIHVLGMRLSISRERSSATRFEPSCPTNGRNRPGPEPRSSVQPFSAA